MNDTRRTIVFGFSLWKVSGFATKPNTLMLRIRCGRRMRFRSSLDWRWPHGDRPAGVLPSTLSGFGPMTGAVCLPPMSKINSPRLRGTGVL